MTETHYPVIPSHALWSSVDEMLEQINVRIDTFGFTVWPLMPDHEVGIPAGFFTVGFTRIGLPEVYVSGIPPHSDEANGIINRLKQMYLWSKDNGYQTTSMDLCRQINATEVLSSDDEPAYQWRPVDAERLMYGQCLAIRYWAESMNLLDSVEGVQIVSRDSTGQFPMQSTREQLLLDYIPFGGVKYQPILEALNNV